MSKPKVIKDYDKLTEDVVEQIKLVYPMGFTSHLVSFTNRDGEKRKGLPFETEKYYYLIRMSEAKAKAIIEDDDDYDDDGNLMKSAKIKYEDKHDDEDFLNELNSNSDNDLGSDEDEN
ncbi:MAG TPA: hypothetical protein DCW83_00655 [Saprospirales bacterium]|jgi:hypothetical protein|nr:hypothetical protein [Saprospiraceae bacterium]HAW03159.1 hypothetical protein [Saprospirales bacterium]